MQKTPDEIKKGLLYHGNTLCDDDCPYWPLNGFGCKGILCDDAFAYIEQLEAKVPKWISVNEQLPKEFATVLIMRDDIKQACVGWLIDGHWSVPKGVRVTHWMPLPEPPAEV